MSHLRTRIAHWHDSITRVVLRQAFYFSYHNPTRILTGHPRSLKALNEQGPQGLEQGENCVLYQKNYPRFLDHFFSSSSSCVSRSQNGSSSKASLWRAMKVRTMLRACIFHLPAPASELTCNWPSPPSLWAS